jgi:hypothetical protein
VAALDARSNLNAGFRGRRLRNNSARINHTGSEGGHEADTITVD